MNDFSEIEYGLAALRRQLSGTEMLAALNRVLEKIEPGMSGSVEYLLRENNSYKKNIYLASLARHEEEEAKHGRLSMWRAYGGSKNVCLVFRAEKLRPYLRAAGVIPMAVTYGQPDIQARFSFAIRGMNAWIGAFQQKELGRMDMTRQHVNNLIETVALTCKHEGFIEEKEVRFVHNRMLHWNLPDCPAQVVDINGSVQEVLYVPLMEGDKPELHGDQLGELLAEIIVGPTEAPHVVEAGFRSALNSAGVDCNKTNVKSCGIPLRR